MKRKHEAATAKRGSIKPIQKKRKGKPPSLALALAEARDEAQRWAARCRRVGHQAEQLRHRLDALAWQARRNTPASIKDHVDLWVVAIEAMAERAENVQGIAQGTVQ